MFDLSWTELLVIGVVALIAIGPKELPGVLRMAGQWMGKIRRMASEFQGQFQEAMREAEVADLKKQVDDLTDTAQSYTNYDPLGDISKQFETAVDAKPAETASAPAAQTPPASAEPVPVAQDNAQAAAPASAEPTPQPSAPEPAAPPQPKVGSAG
jgi:sec-independent protein translocase protein TatB